MIPVSCACGKVLTVGDQLAGKKVRCLGCQAVLEVPLTMSVVEEPANIFEGTLADVTAPVPKPAPPAPKPATPKPAAEPPPKRSTLTYVLLGGAALAVLGCCILGGGGAALVAFVPGLNPFGGKGGDAGATPGHLGSKPAHDRPVKALAFSAD